LAKTTSIHINWQLQNQPT